MKGDARIGQSYVVIARHTRSELEEAIQDAIDNGYKPAGGIQITKIEGEELWVQAVYRKSIMDLVKMILFLQAGIIGFLYLVKIYLAMKPNQC